MSRFALTLTAADAVYIAQHLRPADRAEADATCRPISDEDRGRALASGDGLLFTVWGFDNTPVAMGGWVNLWPGVVSAWMLATDRIVEVGIALDHAALRGHRELYDRGVHRMQAFGLQSRTDTKRWLINLGYIPEGVHPGFGRAGETFVSYAKLAKDIL